MALETKLVQKLDVMIKRCVDTKLRKDAVLIIEGAEGEGKTNASEAIAYYLKHQMKRPIHMFFRLKPLMEFAQSTEEKIIIWDEPALDSLSTDWYKETNKDLIRILMTCRKKRHFFLLNMVKFHKFPEYVVVDRSLGLVHMYTRSKGNEPGRFIYIRRKNLERLFTTYKQKKVREYKTLSSFGGRMPLVEPQIGKLGLNIEGVENATLADYERLKDKAIQSIGQAEPGAEKNEQKLVELKKQVGSLKCPIKNREGLAEQLGISTKTLSRWAAKDTGSILTPDKGQNIIPNGGEGSDELE